MGERWRSGALGVALAGVVVAVVAGLLTVSWAREERTFLASVPQPSPLVNTPVLGLRPDRTACLADITILPDSEVAIIRVGTRGKPGVPLVGTLSGPGGYRSSDRIAGGEWEDNDLLAFQLEAPPRPLHGRFCVRNEGERRVDLYAADDRSRTISEMTVAGRETRANLQLTLSESSPGTVAGHRTRILDELTVFRPGVVTPLVVQVLAVLVVAALTIGAPVAMWLAVRRRDA